MVTRRQRLKHGQARCHPRAEGHCLHAALQICEALFERGAIGIVDPAIEVMTGERSIGVAFKGGGSVERSGDRAGSRVHMPPGVDALVLMFLVRFRHRCHSLILLRRTLGTAMARDSPHEPVLYPAKSGASS